jgi:hypothetical protein
MNLKIHKSGNVCVAELLTDTIIINEVNDAIDLLAESGWLGADAIIIYKHQLNPGFFTLRSGLAGDILQKFSNYRMKLAIVGDFTNVNNKSMKDFIYESNKLGRIIFISSLPEALSVLLK